MKYSKHGIAVIIGLILSCTVWSCKKMPHYELSRFISPDVCGGCHDEIYKQWKNSVHHLSHADPIYRSIALNDLKGISQKDELEEAELCVKCHTPVGFVSGLPIKTSDHNKKIPKLAEDGIQCDFCHSLTGAYKINNASLEIEPGYGEQKPGSKRGPFSGSVSDFHVSTFSSFHTKSEICGSCHDVHHVVFGTKLETPYEEWKKGPYGSDDASKFISCQGCHMYQKPGIPATGSTSRPKNPGKASPDGPDRDHIFTHYFIGGNTLIGKMFNNEQSSRLAEERLKNAASVSISNTISGNVLKISIKNTGAGHKIPTGLTHVRQMWVELNVFDEKNQVMYRDGSLDQDGKLAKVTAIFNTVFGDANGNLVMNVARARTIIKDKRIAPLQTVEESYFLPLAGHTKITVEARLLYRLAPQEVVDSILGKGTMRIPVIEMAKDRKVISL